MNPIQLNLAQVKAKTFIDTARAKQREEESEKIRIRSAWQIASVQFQMMVPEITFRDNIFYTNPITGEQKNFNIAPVFPLYAAVVLPQLFPISLVLNDNKAEDHFDWGLNGYRYIVPGILIKDRILSVAYYPNFDKNIKPTFGTWYDTSYPFPAVWTNDFELALGFAAEYYKMWCDIRSNAKNAPNFHQIIETVEPAYFQASFSVSGLCDHVMNFV